MDFRAKAQEVIKIETRAVEKQLLHLDAEFEHICELLLHCSGRVILMGMGKSGHIGCKIASTLASTGTPAFFVHAAEAVHGDLGMVCKEDIVLAISNSGKTPEFLTIAPVLKQKQVKMIAMTANKNSPLAKLSDHHILIAVDEEACPLGLAPTSSSTATLVMGDAIAITLLSARGFTREAFAQSHPAGNLGKRLLLKVKDFMHTDDEIPMVGPETLLPEALLEMTGKRLGMTVIADQDKQMLGIFTDGDLRRTIQKGFDLHTSRIEDIMIINPKSVRAEDLASFAFDMMEASKITSLPVVDSQNQILGVVHIHDLLEEGL